MAELVGLSGEALRKQQERVNELVIEANRQNLAFKKKNPGAGSQVHSARPNSQKSDGEASSPHPSRSKSKSKSRSGVEVPERTSSYRPMIRPSPVSSKPGRPDSVTQDRREVPVGMVTEV